jgi:Tfp pilus assembly protein PilF
MEREESTKNMESLSMLCLMVRELIDSRDYEKCEALIRSAMGEYPHAPEPHNLIGIMLEKKGDHLAAMKHFRAASALDPAYRPARQNLDCYGTFFSNGKCAYDESDCRTSEERSANKTGGNAHGAGRPARRD